MTYTNLESTFLRSAVLKGTDLRGANLKNASILIYQGEMDGEPFYTGAEIKNAKIDARALEILEFGPFKGLSLEEKKKIWVDRGGILVFGRFLIP